MSMHGPQAHGWPGDDLNVPPHGLDLGAIVQVGRRQVRRRRMAMMSGTAAVLAAVAAIPTTMALRPSGGGGAAGGWPASSGPLPILDCDVTALPLPAEYAEPGPDTYPAVLLAAMDPTGRYVVGNAHLRRPGDAGRPDPDGVIVWDDGRPAMPSPLQGYTEAQDVNPDGVVVGYSSAEGHAWIYRDGRVSRLQTPDGYDSAEAEAINAAGDVAGTAAIDDGSRTMVVWPADDLDHPRVLAAQPGRDDVDASGITDDGRVVGRYYAEAESGDWPAETGIYLWEPDGTLVELPVPEGAYDVDATAVRGNWAVGRAMVEPEGPQQTAPPPSIRWDLRTRTLELVPDSGDVPNQVEDISGAGDLLFLVPPAVTRGGEAYALPDPVEEGAIILSPEPTYEVYVHSISDDGSMITGDVYYAPDQLNNATVSYPVMWRC